MKHISKSKTILLKYTAFYRVFSILFILLILVLTNIAPVFADFANPVPKLPLGQKDKFQTDVFTGSAAFSYPIQVPKGTNDLTPDVSLDYNSGSAHDADSA